jgi:hypothetical protein
MKWKIFIIAKKSLYVWCQKHCILDAEITVAQNAEIIALPNAVYRQRYRKCTVLPCSGSGVVKMRPLPFTGPRFPALPQMTGRERQSDRDTRRLRDGGTGRPGDLAFGDLLIWRFGCWEAKEEWIVEGNPAVVYQPLNKNPVRILPNDLWLWNGKPGKCPGGVSYL